MNHTALTLLILHFNALLDSGKYDDVTVDEVFQCIDDGSILHFLRERIGTDIDLSIHLDSTTYGDFEKFYVTYLQAILDGGADPKRKFAVQNKGLCLLVAWTNEIIQQGSGWQPETNIGTRQ